MASSSRLPSPGESARRPRSSVVSGRAVRIPRVVVDSRREELGGATFEPDTYAEEIRADIPRFDELQEQAIAAIPASPGRVLELGIGTGETTRRLLERFPRAQVTGLDSSAEMAFRARELGIDVRLARMEDPLPDGPWDLVISVLAVHELRDEQKRDLFRRVREQSTALVLGDVVAVERPVAPLEEGVDFPAPVDALAEWCGGEVCWQADDLAVVRAIYD
jgi:tRNA (cmo5U34)-methyltransferase